MKLLILITLFSVVSCQQKDLELVPSAVNQPGKSLPSPVPAASISSGMAPSSGG